MKKEVLSPIEEFCDKKKFHKIEEMYSKVDYLSEMYFLYVLLWQLFRL